MSASGTASIRRAAMTRSNRPTRTEVAQDYGHPWPWTVEELLRREFERRDGDIRALARAFGCHPRTVDKWVRRFDLRGGPGDVD